MALSTARREQLARLLKLQNNGRNDHVDIMTITGFMDDAQVEAHIASYERAELEQIFRKRSKGAR